MDTWFFLAPWQILFLPLPFGHLQLDFIRLLLSIGYQQVLVILFFGRVEALPICHATISSVAKILIEKIRPTSGIPSPYIVIGDFLLDKLPSRCMPS